MEEAYRKIDSAYKILSGEVSKRNIQGVQLSIQDDKIIKIHLIYENRTVWIGYDNKNGYFLSWDTEQINEHYFNLSESQISEFLLAISDTHSTLLLDKEEGNTLNQVTNYDPVEYLNSIDLESTNVKKIKQFIENSRPTDEGINYLALISFIKSFKMAIIKLKLLIDRQSELKYDKNEYQKIISKNPWMLGSHYNKVLFYDRQIWFDSRIDMMLATVTGYIDVVEIKEPDVQLLVENEKGKYWRLSEELADAIAQAQKYLRDLDEHRLDIIKELKIDNLTFSPRLYMSDAIIIAGRTPKEEGALNALRELNSNTRVFIMTYDDYGVPHTCILKAVRVVQSPNVPSRNPGMTRGSGFTETGTTGPNTLK